LNGNHHAEEVFFNKYQKIVKNYIRGKFTKINSDDLDDCVSEILIKTFQYLSKYDKEKSSVKTWVLVIAKHYLIDRWRSNTAVSASTGTHTFTISTDTAFDIGSTSSNSGFIASTSNSGFITASNVNNLAFTANNTFTSSNNSFENCSAINYISTQISPTDFTLLDMKYVQGYDYNEIGKEFNVTSSTISNRVNYIKTKLKKNYSEIIYD